MIAAARLLTALATLLFTGAARAECGAAEAPCTLAQGQYHLAEPPGWDGETALPVMMFIHGYNSSGAAYRRNTGFVGAWNRAGFLLVLPSGSGKSWAHRGSPKPGDDIPFLMSVLDDIEARYPVASMSVSGFSQGGSMVWDLACRAPQRFDGFYPVAGAFWRPLPRRCAAPVTLRHIHGTADRVVPMAGRPIAGRYHQGDVMRGLAILQGTNACAAEADHSYTSGNRTCSVWSSCASGRLELCLHEGGHAAPRGWIAETARLILDGSRPEAAGR